RPGEGVVERRGGLFGQGRVVGREGGVGEEFDEVVAQRAATPLRDGLAVIEADGGARRVVHVQRGLASEERQVAGGEPELEARGQRAGSRHAGNGAVRQAVGAPAAPERVPARRTDQQPGRTHFRREPERLPVIGAEELYTRVHTRAVQLVRAHCPAGRPPALVQCDPCAGRRQRPPGGQPGRARAHHRDVERHSAQTRTVSATAGSSTEGTSPLSGTRTVKVLPCPGTLSTETSPPSIRHRRRVTLNPRPVPLARLEADCSTCQNASKMRSWCSGGMPIPVSRTPNTAHGPSTATDSTTSPR